jgi:hypothetical protein
MTQKDYGNVIQERNSAKLCGYPTCSKPLSAGKGRFKLSRSERQIYDTSEWQSQFCSKECMLASKYLGVQLSEEPPFLRARNARLKIRFYGDDVVDSSVDESTMQSE